VHLHLDQALIATPCRDEPSVRPLCLWHGRYAFSSDVARALVETHAIAPLKFMPNEDATFGFWVMVCIHDRKLMFLILSALLPYVISFMSMATCTPSHTANIAAGHEPAAD
jgi:hypothetical protein